jgi:hypothetical protein
MAYLDFGVKNRMRHHVDVTVPKALESKMRQFEEVNWPDVARKAFEKYCSSRKPTRKEGGD